MRKIIAIILISLAFIPLVMNLLENFAMNSMPEKIKNQDLTDVNKYFDKNGGIEYQLNNCDSTSVSIFIQVNAIDQVKNTINCRYYFYFPDSIKRGFRDKNTLKHIFRNYGSKLKLDTSYNDLALSFQVVNSLGSSSNQCEIPLQRIDHQQNINSYNPSYNICNDLFYFDIEIPVLGFPNSYPNDWYANSSYYQLVTGNNITYLQYSDQRYMYSIPIKPKLLSSPLITEQRIRYSDIKEATVQPLFNIVIERHFLNVYFVYLISFLPYLFCFFISHSILTKKKAIKQYLYDISAVLLSIFSLKFVVVKSEFTIVSRVDLLLITPILFVVSLILYKLITDFIAATQD